MSSDSTWRVELDRVWDVLAPFPVHAREQHFLSPAYPLDLSLPIDTNLRYPTSLTHTAHASWSQTTADPHGTIRVAHPSVPWAQIRATEGWASLQHINVLRGWLAIHPPSDLTSHTAEPLLCTELLQGAFFAVLPSPDSPQRKTHLPKWHHGNIYALERAPAQLLRLPVSPASSKDVTKYEVIICAPYEIRLFGDPLSYSSPHPILTINFSVSLQFPCPPPPLRGIDRAVNDAPLQQIPARSITPHIVDGAPFGDAIGIGIQCLDFGRCTKRARPESYWTIVRAHLPPSLANLPSSLSVDLLDEVPIRVIPSQTRIVPLRLSISPSERIPENIRLLDVDLTCVPSTSTTFNQASSNAHGGIEKMAQSAFVLRATISLTHVPLWTQEKHLPIQASYFFANSMPTVFLVKPPKEAFYGSQVILGQQDKIDTSKCRGNEPILALHGAGVDIRSQSFWPDSLLRQKYAWVVMPQGLTAWGLDWHGPSAADAFASVSALSLILSNSGSGRWAQWGFSADTRVILMGHSNGGQGAWYIANRWPDRVCAVVPAAGYIKSQAYVPLSMSRFAHFVDPALHAVLDSSFTPDDNDIFLGNLVGKPVLALHGGADDNVPVWHTREQVGILKTLDPDADVAYHEDPGQPHWYFEVLYNEHVQAFLDRVYFSSSSRFVEEGKALGTNMLTSRPEERKAIDFTLTVSVPIESGSLNGWQIHTLTTPGLLGRIRVTASTDGNVSVRTTNVAVFSLDSSIWAAARGVGVKDSITLEIDGYNISVDPDNSSDTILFVRDAVGTGTAGFHPNQSSWKVLVCPDPSTTATRYRLRAPPRRLQSILSTRGASLTLLVPSLTASSPELSAALRIAHALQLFHALDAQIVSIAEVESENTLTAPLVANIQKGNLVVIGCADAPLVGRWLKGGIWSYADEAWHVGATRLDRSSSAILFCQPHPYDDNSVALFVQSTDPSGLERAVRLFPIRTGVHSPDWLVVDARADKIGAAGVQGAGVYGWKPPTTGSLEDGSMTTNGWKWNERMSWFD